LNPQRFCNCFIIGRDQFGRVRFDGNVEFRFSGFTFHPANRRNGRVCIQNALSRPPLLWAIIIN
jgi:hypothetical protein